MMARLLDLSKYRHGTHNVPIPSPVQEALRCPALQECNVLRALWNSLWPDHYQQAWGRHRSIQQIGLPSQHHAEKLWSPRRRWHLWCPMIFARSITSISRALVPLPVENLRQVGAAMRPQDTRSSSRSSSYVSIWRPSHSLGKVPLDTEARTWWGRGIKVISLFMCVCLLVEIMSFDDGIIHNNQQERTFPWEVFKQSLAQHACQPFLCWW